MSKDEMRSAELSRGGVAAAVGTIVSRVAHALAYLGLARLLAPDQLAEMALAAVVVNAFALFPAFGLGTALLAGKENPRRLVASALTLALLGGVALVVLAWCSFPVWTFFFDRNIATLVAVLACTLAFRGLSSVAAALLDREFRFRERAIAEAAGGIAFLAVSLVAAMLGLGALSIAWGLVASSILTAAMQMKSAGVRPTFSPSFRALKTTSQVGAIVLGTTVLQWAFFSAEPVLIERWFGKETLGYYCLASYLMLMPANFLGFLASRLALPALVDAREREVRVAEPFVRTMRTSTALWAMAAAPMILAAESVVWLAYGEAKLPAASFLAAFALFSYGRVIGSFGGPALVAHGRASVAWWCVLGQLVVAVPLAWWVSSRGNAVGVAWAFGAVVLIASMVTIEVGARRLGIARRRWSVAAVGVPSLILGAGVAVAALPIPGASWWGVLTAWLVAAPWALPPLIPWVAPVVSWIRDRGNHRTFEATNRL